MSKEPTRPTLQRIQTESDEELDDLDDVLDEFTPSQNAPFAPPPNATTRTPSAIVGNRPRHNTRVDAPPISIPGTGPRLQSTVEEEELDPGTLSAEFSRELEKGMESLMREITTGLATGDNTGSSFVQDANTANIPVTDIEREKALKAAWEAMFVEELEGMDGLEELLGKDDVKPKPNLKDTTGTTNDFQSRIKKTMNKLKESESTLQSGTGSGSNVPANPESIEELLKSFGELGLGEGDNDDAELAGFLENMMGQLMSKDVLYEPLKELSTNFPGYLSDPPQALSPGDRTRYEKQYSYVKEIIQIFEKPDYSNDSVEDKKTIMELMSEMQNLGSPPAEIMGPLPPGFDNGMPKLGDDNCIIT